MKLEVLSQQDSSPEEWDSFIYSSPQGGPFMLYHWMSCVEPTWEYLQFSKNEKVVARMPIGPKRKLIWSYALQPLFCQHWGICFVDSVDIETADECFQSMAAYWQKRFSIFKYYFSPYSPAIHLSIPKHGQISKRITHTAELINDPIENFSPAARRQVNKAIKGEYSITNDFDLNAFENIVRENAGLMNTTQLQLLRNLILLLQKDYRVLLLQAKMKSEIIVAGGIFIPYMERLYYLAGVVSPAHRNSGVMSALLLEAMRMGRREGKKEFDFEGSMNPGIARFFKGLGGKELEYNCIEFNRLPLPQLWKKF